MIPQTPNPEVVSMFEIVDIMAEALIIALAAFIIYKFARMSYLLNNTFKAPLRYFTVGFAFIGFSITWELTSQHFVHISYMPPGMHDFLLAVGTTFVAIATFKIYRLIVPGRQ